MKYHLKINNKIFNKLFYQNHNKSLFTKKQLHFILIFFYKY